MAVGGGVAAALAVGACGASTSTTSSTAPPANAFNQGLVGPPSTGTVTSPATQSTSKSKSGSKGKTTSKAAATSRSTTRSGGGTATVTKTVTVRTGGGGGGGGGRTVTVRHTVTVRALPSGVPQDAELPSLRGTQHVSAFQTASGHIGCRLGGGAARCDIAHRSWKPPGAPSGCHVAYGQGLEVGPSGLGHFVCASNSVLNPTGLYIPAGFDVSSSGVTCQVRNIGVTCYDGQQHGFFVGPTGYFTF